MAAPNIRKYRIHLLAQAPAPTPHPNVIFSE